MFGVNRYAILETNIMTPLNRIILSAVHATGLIWSLYQPLKNTAAHFHPLIRLRENRCRHRSHVSQEHDDQTITTCFTVLRV